MVYKCSVIGCNNNFDAQKGETSRPKVTLFRFPTDKVERNVWIKCLPNSDFWWTDSERVCIEHWPIGFPTRVVNRNGATAPTGPPSVFSGVPPSCIPTPPPTKRLLFGPKLPSPGPKNPPSILSKKSFNKSREGL